MSISDLDKFAIRRRNILGDLAGWHRDPSEWTTAESDLVAYGIHYDYVVDDWLEAALLYSYAHDEFGRLFLTKGTRAKIDKNKFQPHHYRLLQRYWIARGAVSLVRDGVVDVDALESSSECYYQHLAECGYESEGDAIADLEVEARLSVNLPELIVKRLMGQDYSVVARKLEREELPQGGIWNSAWRFLKALVWDPSELANCWHAVLIEWKKGYRQSDSEGFSKSLFVLFYFLYCQEIEVPFDLSDLSEALLSS